MKALKQLNLLKFK